MMIKDKKGAVVRVRELSGPIVRFAFHTCLRFMYCHGQVICWYWKEDYPPPYSFETTDRHTTGPLLES